MASSDVSTALLQGGTNTDYRKVLVDSSGYLLVNIAAGATSGTQYTEGDVDASITGTAVMWEDAGNTLQSVSSATPLPVNIVAGASSGVQYTEGDSDTSITGTAAMAEGNGNTLQPLKVNGSQHLEVSLEDIAGNTIQTGNGSTGSGTIRVAIADDTTWKPHIQDSAGNNIVVGQTTMTGSVPVVIASNQTDIPISASSLPLPSGAATSANQTTIIGHVDGIEGLLTTIDADTGTLAAAVTANKVQVDVITMPTTTVTATNLDIRDLVFATDKVDASGTVLGAGTNNIGDVDVLTLPAVTIAAAQTLANVTTVGSITNTVTTKETRSGTATHANVAGSASSVTLISSNANRLGGTVFNDSTAILYVKLGATASTTSFITKLYEDDYYEIPFGYTGVVDGIWASATGSARVVEFT